MVTSIKTLITTNLGCNNMSLTQQQLEAYKDYREDRCCKCCSWFGHLACNCKYEERVAARELRGGLCENRWNALRSRVMGCKEKRKAACSVQRKVQQGVKCWRCGKAGHCLWMCPKKAARPENGKAQQREVRRMEEDKVQRKWHKRERMAERMGQLWKRGERGWIEHRGGK